MTPDDLKIRYPELSEISDPALTLAIDDAKPWLNEARWGGFYRQGLASLAAHIARERTKATKTVGAPQTAVTSRKAGDVQMTYAALAPGGQDEVWLGASVYGQRYLALRRLVGLGAMVAP